MATVTRDQCARIEGSLRPGPVLLATAGNDVSDAPVIAARHVAERLGRPVKVVTVLKPSPCYGGTAAGLVPWMAYDDFLQSAREEQVRHYLGQSAPPTEEWPVTVRVGSVAHEIAATARELSASIIIVGATATPRRGHHICGDRAAKILRSADCPVLSVALLSAQTVHRAVAAVDFGPLSTQAAEAALALLQPGGTLTLVHVISNVEPEADRVTETTTRLCAQLRKTLEASAPASATIDMRILHGVPIEAISTLAAQVRADLIAVGTHGPNVVERLFLGSTAASVLRAAGCSVLACPPSNEV